MEKEANCINSKVILDYVNERRPEAYRRMFPNLHPEIDTLPDPEAFLRDTNNWISCSVLSKLWERGRSIFDDDRFAFNVAKYAVENTSLGYAQRITVKAFWSHKMALKQAQKINDKWNRSKRVELTQMGRNHAIVRLHWDPDMQVTRDMCLMNQGTYTFLPLIWGGKPLNLEERRCYFEGAPFCEYHLKWPMTNRFRELLSRLFTSKSVLKDTVREMEADKMLLEDKYEEVNRLNVELDRKVKQLTAIQETGKAIVSVLDLEQLLSVIMNLLSNVCRINRALIMLLNEEKGCLEYLHAVGFEGNVPDEVRQYRVPLDRVSNLLVRVASTGKSEYIPEVDKSTLKRDNIILAYGRPTSIYAVPLITRSRVIGVIATDAVDASGVPRETRDTLGIFSSHIAIAIENARLYHKLQDQMEELKRSHALLSRAEKFSFLGNLAARLAHEIKNPLTAIGTFIQLLPLKYDDEEFRNEFYQIALEETHRVNNLITELLDLVKKKESHFELNDLHSIIDKMVLLMSPQTKAKEIEVVRRFDPEIGPVWLDPEKIKQVILNLLSNAVEFTPRGGQIEIVTLNGSTETDTERISIVIRDNGAGIAEAMLENIFDPYFTTKHRSDMHSGTGLGLFIAHQNVQDHGGTIEVDSRVREGTTFTVTLPAKPPAGFPSSQQD
jgi:signal transduction histidine kinase